MTLETHRLAERILLYIKAGELALKSATVPNVSRCCTTSCQPRSSVTPVFSPWCLLILQCSLSLSPSLRRGERGGGVVVTDQEACRPKLTRLEVFSLHQLLRPGFNIEQFSLRVQQRSHVSMHLSSSATRIFTLAQPKFASQQFCLETVRESRSERCQYDWA